MSRDVRDRLRGGGDDRSVRPRHHGASRARVPEGTRGEWLLAAMLVKLGATYAGEL